MQLLQHLDLLELIGHLPVNLLPHHRLNDNHRLENCLTGINSLFWTNIARFWNQARAWLWQSTTGEPCLGVEYLRHRQARSCAAETPPMDILAQECTELYSKRVYPWHFPDYRNVSRPRQMVGGASAAGEGRRRMKLNLWVSATSGNINRNVNRKMIESLQTGSEWELTESRDEDDKNLNYLKTLLVLDPQNLKMHSMLPYALGNCQSVHFCCFCLNYLVGAKVNVPFLFIYLSALKFSLWLLTMKSFNLGLGIEGLLVKWRIFM